MLANVQQTTIQPIIEAAVVKGTLGLPRPHGHPK